MAEYQSDFAKATESFAESLGYGFGVTINPFHKEYYRSIAEKSSDPKHQGPNASGVLTGVIGGGIFYYALASVIGPLAAAVPIISGIAEWASKEETQKSESLEEKVAA